MRRDYSRWGRRHQANGGQRVGHSPPFHGHQNRILSRLSDFCRLSAKSAKSLESAKRIATIAVGKISSLSRTLPATLTPRDRSGDPHAIDGSAHYPTSKTRPFSARIQALPRGRNESLGVPRDTHR